MKNAIYLGRGELSWPPFERVSNRYGMITLGEENRSTSTSHPPTAFLLDTVQSLLGRKGTLIALVKETRQSTHIGDLFRGIFPPPLGSVRVGEEFILGTGTFFAVKIINGTVEGTWGIGLVPRDLRVDDWLFVNALYATHEQTVEIWFKENAR